MFGESATTNLENAEVMLCFPRDLSSWSVSFSSVCLDFLSYNREKLFCPITQALMVRTLQISKAVGK